jgi:hypothetical protein
MKKCFICKTDKLLSEFYKHKTTKDGFENRCKICFRQWQKNRYYLNRESRIDQVKEYKRNNRSKVNEYKNQWQKDNREKLRPYFRVYNQQRKINDINFKIAASLRTRLYIAMHNHQKVGSAVKDLGCSIQELKIYFESKFKPGMSWKNWGKWHIDHVQSLASFDLTKREELLKACHYSNLQPLWAKENIRKQ